MYKCCIFDLDGTLLDTLAAIAYTCNKTMASYGFEPLPTEDYKLYVGDGASKLIERVLKVHGDEELTLHEQALALYHENFVIHSLHEVHPYDGIEELLAFIKEEGMKMAVLSNKPHPRTIDNIETVFGKGYFDHVQGEQPHVKRKPDPSGAFQVMEILGVKQEECLYIGDTNTDMMTGRNAGLDTVGVTWGFRGEEELRSYGPAYIAHHPKEIIEIIKSKKM